MRRGTAFVLLATLAAGCQARAPQPVITPASSSPLGAARVATATDAAGVSLDAATSDASDGSSPDASAAYALLRDPASSWSDPRMVALLAVDCDARHPSPPVRPEGEETEDGVDPFEGWQDPLSCEGEHEQSCTFDPCFEGDSDPCKAECSRGCDQCQARCRGSCGECRQSCQDDQCRQRCASRCAGCLDECSATRDRCATGVCARRYAACVARSVSEWRRTCRSACARCQRVCPEDAPAECITRCLTRNSRCTETQRQICGWHGTNYGEPER
jgi:hypothetical protein